MTTCEKIGHQLRDGTCMDCGKALADTPLAVGQRVYEPRRLPVGSVIFSTGCGPMTVLGFEGDYVLTTECRCGESKIGLWAAAWLCGWVVLEALP